MFVFSLLFFNLPSGSPLVCLLPSFPCNFVIMILTSKVLFFLILSIRKTGIIKTSSFLFQDKNGQQKAGVHVSKLHVHRLLTIPLYYFTNASVSLAIASSSLVGITWNREPKSRFPVPSLNWPRRQSQFPGMPDIRILSSW